MILLSVDPGIRGVGAALYRGQSLIAAAYVKNPVTRGNQTAACVAAASAVWEWVRDVVQIPRIHAVPVTARAMGLQLPDVIAVEWPRMYLPDKQEGDQNDLPPLAGVDCALGALFIGAELVTYYPDEWKGGQVPKQEMNDRVWKRLSDEERSRVVQCGKLTHNVLDGVGIGMHHLGRLERQRVLVAGTNSVKRGKRRWSFVTKS